LAIGQIETPEILVGSPGFLLAQSSAILLLAANQSNQRNKMDFEDITAGQFNEPRAELDAIEGLQGDTAKWLLSDTYVPGAEGCDCPRCQASEEAALVEGKLLMLSDWTEEDYREYFLSEGDWEDPVMSDRVHAITQSEAVPHNLLGAIICDNQLAWNIAFEREQEVDRLTLQLVEAGILSVATFTNPEGARFYHDAPETEVA
jgi:hypothetical protein